MEELHKRVQDGEIGDIILMRGYRMHGPVGSAFSTKWPGNPTELMWQIQRFHSFLWASGGCYSDLPLFSSLCPQLVIGKTVGSGHFPTLEVPEQVNSMIEHFIKAYLKN